MAGLVLALWLAGYTVYWFDRSVCTDTVTRCLLRAFGDWFGDVIMLGWVERYQTLLAGFLAFGAGIFVLMSYQAQRRDLIEDRAKERRDGRLASLHSVRHQANIFHSQLITSSIDIDATLGPLRIATASIAEFAPGLGAWVVYVADMIKDLWGDPRDIRLGLEGERQRVKALELSTLMVAYLENVERLLDEDGQFRNVPAPRSAAGNYDPNRHHIMAAMFEKE